jgi:hypothetical protein
MNLDLEAVAKAVYVALLLLFIAAMDRLQINDQILRNTAFGLIGTIGVWHGAMKVTGAGSAVQTLQQVLALVKPAALPAPTAVVPQAPATPAQAVPATPAHQ